MVSAPYTLKSSLSLSEIHDLEIKMSTNNMVYITYFKEIVIILKSLGVFMKYNMVHTITDKSKSCLQISRDPAL
jgi:hypothetical protein